MLRRLAALAALTGLGLAAVVPGPASAGCGLSSSGPGARFRSGTVATAPILVYGDSITFQVAERLVALRPEVAVDAWPGRRTRDAVEALLRDVEGRPAPRVVVMAMGTNDTRWPEQVGALARLARAGAPAGTRVLWLTTYAEPWPGWERVNAELAAVPGVELLDWEGANRAARADGSSSPLLVDGVHLACPGADAWLDLVGTAVSRRS